MRSSIVLGLSVLAVACTGQQQQAPVRSVAQPAPAPAPYRAPAPAPQRAAAPAPAPSADWHHVPSSGGPIAWTSSISDAQAQARAQGKLILVASTKPGCSLCDIFAHQTAPACAGDLSRVAVAYIYNILKPEDGRVDRTLRTNLPGAAVMPLVGFLTPDLQWVTGFWGPRSVSEFMGDIATARRSQPVSAAQAEPTPPAGPLTAFVNEYGETEWSAPADVWPAPKDALAGEPAIAAAPAVAVAPLPVPAEPVASREPASVGAVGPAPVVEVAPAPVAALDPAPMPAWSDAPASLPAGIAASTGPAPRGEAPFAAPAPEAPAPAAAPAPAPAPVAVEPAPAVTYGGPLGESEARAELDRAYRLIQAGRYDEARTALRLVSRSLPGTSLGREADRGGVAIYNARRIAEAGADERGDLQTRARRDLGTSMWVTLF